MLKYTLPLHEIGRSHVLQCGGKGANLGELIQAGMRVPAGFCVATDALLYTLDYNSLLGPIADVAARLNFDNYAAVDADTARIRSMVVSARIPPDLEQAVIHRYRELISGEEKLVAVRSSVAVRESSVSSFPGMMDTYHFVQGERETLNKIRECWASLWTTRAAFARHQKGIRHDRGLIAPVVQLMINADTAGVLFTANPITYTPGEMVIESNWGLGESVVSGRSMNDFYTIDRDTLSIGKKSIARKTVMVTMDGGRGAGRTEQPVPPEKQFVPTLSDAQLVELGEAGKRIERHFGFNVDVEWAYRDGTLYILQARQIRRLRQEAAS
jgi:pyruvate,water dikinase